MIVLPLERVSRLTSFRSRPTVSPTWAVFNCFLNASMPAISVAMTPDEVVICTVS